MAEFAFTELERWAIAEPGPIDSHPLVKACGPRPDPEPGQGLVRVRVCGVCRTDLHLAEGDLAPRRGLVTPGHEVVGTIEALGRGPSRFAIGDRVGIGWLASTCGTCLYCCSGRENLCIASSFTGWDLDGGYANYLLANLDYIYAIPARFSDEHAAPLLCAGIIGYRVLKLSALPPGGRLGIYGFGASAHLVAQVALARGATLHVITRSESARRLALYLGAASAGGELDAPPERLDAAIVFAPTGATVPRALSHLDRGGNLAIAGVHLSPIPQLDYSEHLFEERSLTSVTSSTRSDGEEFLELAADIGMKVTTTPYPMAQANAALSDLAHGKVRGAAVLQAVAED